MLNAFMLSVAVKSIMLSVVTLSVVASSYSPTLLPALAILTAHSAAETPSMSPIGPMHMVAATA
jgi:hypothetical protein